MTIELLQTAAGDLGGLCGKVVFLGGVTVGLWFSDPAARPPRVTYDVDVGSNLVLDVLPLDARLAGLGGRWLKPAVRAAVQRALPSGIAVRVVAPPWLIVTKLEAFADPGKDDCLSSRDFEDVALLVDSRDELAGELAALPGDARAYVRAELTRMLDLATSEYGVEGALAAADSGERARRVTIPRFHALARS